MESNFSDGYKLMSGKLDQRLKRSQRRSIDWKNLRKEQQNKRRGMNDMSPLQEVFDNSNTVSNSPGIATGSTADRKNSKSTVNKKTTGGEDRLALLAKWKKAKEAKKREEALENARKRPFKVCKIKYNDKFYSNKTTAGPVVLKSSEPSKKKEAISKGGTDPTTKKNASSNIKRKADNVQSTNTVVEKPKETQPKGTRRKDVKATGNSRQRASPARRTTRQTAAASRLLAATASSIAKKVDKTRGSEQCAVKGKSLSKKQTTANQKDKKECKENISNVANLDTSKVRNDRGMPEDFTFTAPSNLKSYVFKPTSPTSSFSFLSSNQDSSSVSFFISDEDTGRCSTPRSSESSEKHESDSTTPARKTASGSQPMKEEIDKHEGQTLTNNEKDCDENLVKSASSSEDESHTVDLDIVKASAGKTPRRQTRQSKTEAFLGSNRPLRRSTRGNTGSVDQLEQRKEQTKSVSDDESGRSTRSQKLLRRSVRSSAHNGTMDSITENGSSDDYFNCSQNEILLIPANQLEDSVFAKPDVVPISNNDKHSDEMETDTENINTQKQSIKENKDEKVDGDLTMIEMNTDNLENAFTKRKSQVSNEDSNLEKTLMEADESEMVDIDQKQSTIIEGCENTVTEESKLMETEENTILEKKETSNEQHDRKVDGKSLNDNTICEYKSQEVNGETLQAEHNENETSGTTTASRESLDLATFRTPGAPPSSKRRTRRKTVASSKPANARSPEEWVKVLQNSPMIEMKRRTPKEKSPLSDNIVQPLNFDDIEDDIPHITLMNANKQKPEEEKIPAEVEDNNTKTAQQEDSQHQTQEEPQEVMHNDLKMQEERHTEEETQIHDVPYFRNLTKTEDSRLSSLGEDWTNYLQENSHLSEEVQGCIRTVIGQAQLLRDQRFKQFTDLIDNCEFKRGEKETTCQDLSGFWDMIYFQVEDVNKKFKELSERKDANWRVEEKVTKTKKVVKKKVIKSSKPSAKSKFAEFRAQMLKEKQETKKVSPQLLKTFDAGFFKVNSPIKKSPHFHCEGGTPKKSKVLSASKPFAEKLDCEPNECQMEVDDQQENEVKNTPQNVGAGTIGTGEKGDCEETMKPSEVLNGQQEMETKTEMVGQQMMEIDQIHEQDKTCDETKPQDQIVEDKKNDTVNVVEKNSPSRQPLAPLSTGSGELRTPRRKSYAPVIPSPLLHDITPKPKTRRSLAVNTPKQIKSEIDICPLTATPKSRTRRKTITAAETIQVAPSIEMTTPKSSKKEDATPRRRSSRLRKSVCFNDTPTKTRETITETNYEALFLPSTGCMDSPSESDPVVNADITNSSFSLDSLLDKTDKQSSPKVTPKASRRRSVKRLPSDEKRRRSTRRSVHFDKSQEDHNGSGIKLRSTPYTRSSRRSKSSAEDGVLFSPPQKEESTGLHDIKSRPSLLFTPPQNGNENVAAAVDNLMMFTP